MSPTAADLRELIRAEGSTLLVQLERLAPDDWAGPSPCAGWDVLDVVVHMQLGTWVHTGMVANALAGRMEPPWTPPEGEDAHDTFRRVQREAHAEGPAHNLARLRERLAGYDAALARVTDADLERPAWFYGLPADLRKVVTAYANDLVVHSADVRRPLGLEPWFSPAGGRLVGQYVMPFLPMFTSAERLGRASGTVRQVVDGITTVATLGPDGVRVTAPEDDPDAPAARPEPSATIVADGGTWALLTWRQLPPVEAERLGTLRITGDRALVERYLGAIRTP
jgi:uncharacterized protein (TIGR03083 family)